MSKTLTAIMLNELECNFRKWDMKVLNAFDVKYWNDKYNLVVITSKRGYFNGTDVTYRVRGGDYEYTGVHYYTGYSENSTYKFLVAKIKSKNAKRSN